MAFGSPKKIVIPKSPPSIQSTTLKMSWRSEGSAVSVQRENCKRQQIPREKNARNDKFRKASSSNDKFPVENRIELKQGTE
jgi:hypothetical protein